MEIVKEGFNDPQTGKGRLTRVRATQALINLMTGGAKLTIAQIGRRRDESTEEVIILKDDEKNRIEYCDNEITKCMRDDLIRINDLLQGIGLILIYRMRNLKNYRGVCRATKKVTTETDN